MGVLEAATASAAGPDRLSVEALPYRRPRSIPVVIVTGFLGSGKTTLLQKLMAASRSIRLAIIVNEFGSVGIDGDLLDSGRDQVVELAGGCMCCENRGDMVRAIGSLLTHGSAFDALVIETSGLADPLGVATVLISYDFGHELLLSSVVTVVDACNFDRNLDHAEAAFQQLVSADVFVIGKADLVDVATVDLIKERLSRINPAAPTTISRYGDCAYDVLLEPAAAPAVLNRHNDPAGITNEGFSAFSWSGARTLDLTGFVAWVEGLPDAVCRVKAIVPWRSHDYAVHRVGRRVTVLRAEQMLSSGDGPGEARVTIIGRDLDSDQFSGDLIALSQSKDNE